MNIIHDRALGARLYSNAKERAARPLERAPYPFSRAVAAGALLIGLLTTAAWAHGSAQWIMENDETRFCCGPEDCQAIIAVQFTPTGWTFEHPHTGNRVLVPFGFLNRYRSNDDQFWACFYLAGEGKPLRCFFTPDPGV